jgi:hypothetical protein
MDKNTQPNITEVATRAEEAFWDVVAQSYPDIKTGDMAPDVSIALKSYLENTIKTWVEANRR